ncbi:MAG: hypothetical protein RIE77_08280 [Phycisphaerales bacterium]|jgi:hypothetical protein
MVDATIRWSLYILSLVVIGPIAGVLMSLSDAPDGSAGTALASASPVVGVLSLVFGSALAAAIGGVAAYRCGLRPGLTCAGIVMTWMAGMSAGIVSAISAFGDGPWGLLVAEGVVVALCLIGVGVVVTLAAQRHVPVPGEHITPQSIEAMEAEKTLAFSPRTLGAIAIAVAGGAAVAWVLAVTDIKGQVIAAAAVAAVVIAVLAKLVDVKAPAIGAIGAAALLAIAAPAYAFATVAADSALASAYAQALPGIVRVTPLDWAAGALLGTPIGLAWAASIVKRAEG